MEIWDETNYHSYVDNDNRDAFVDRVGLDNIIDHQPIGEKTLFTVQTPFDNKYIKINIAIAAAVTANARIYMSQYKNNPDFNLYYSDTDSLLIDKPLSPELVHKPHHPLPSRIGYTNF